MAFDYKKEYKDLYQPKRMPAIVTVPAMRFVAVDGVGDPNEEGGDYAKAMQLLYGISFTIKMNKKSNNPDEHIDGYFDYTVPPLEGLWSMEKGVPGVDYTRKTDFYWTSMIRLPEFVTDEVFAWAKASFASKHPEVDINRAYLFDFDEGVVAQVMHKGPYDDEPATVTILEDYLNSFDGIVVVVSHDRYFLDNVADRIFEMDGQGEIRQYEGGYTDYLNVRLSKEKALTKGVQNLRKNEDSSSKKPRHTKLRFSYKEQKEYEEIDGVIAELEEKLEMVDQEMVKFATNSIKLTELTKVKEETEQALEEKMERWVYLNDLAERIEAQNAR